MTQVAGVILIIIAFDLIRRGLKGLKTKKINTFGLHAPWRKTEHQDKDAKFVSSTAILLGLFFITIGLLIVLGIITPNS